jgi:hypothetical protein
LLKTLLARFLARLVCVGVWASGSLAQPTDSSLPSVNREREHGGQVVFVRPVSNGGPIVSVDYQGGVFLWDPLSLRQISTQRRVPFPVKSATVVDPATLLVVGSGDQDFVALISLRTLTAAKVLGRIGGEVQSLSDSLGDRRVRVVIASDQWIRVREIDSSGAFQTVLDLPRLNSTAVTISADGRLVAVATQAKELSLIEADTGRVIWTRQTEAMVTSLSVGTDAGVVLGGYDNVISFTLKSIDQYSIESGKTLRRILVEPCSVFQVELIDRDRGMAICGPSALDGLVNLSKRILPSFVTWRLTDERSTPRFTAIPGALPGASAYLPFRAGVSLDPSTDTLIASGGNGSLVGLKLHGTVQPTRVERLAPAPGVVQRLAIDAVSRRIIAVTRIAAPRRNVVAKSDDWPEVAKSALSEALPSGSFTEEELNAGLDLDIARQSPRLRNSLTSWDADAGTVDFSTRSSLGMVQDVAGAASSSKGSVSIAEVLSVSTSNPVETTVFAVSLLPTGEISKVHNRRLFSINSATGLLQEGIRRPKTEITDFAPGVCPSALQTVNVRLSGNGDVLLVACPAVRAGTISVQEDLRRPLFDLLTHWLGTAHGFPSKRVSIIGMPSQIELSADGSKAAVISSTTPKADRVGPTAFDSEYALTVVDLAHGEVVGRIDRIPEPSLGTAIAFASDGRKIYLSLESRVYAYTQGASGLVDVALPTGTTGSANISSIAVDDAAELLAVSRHDGTTKVFRLSDHLLVGAMSHPGETLTELRFDAAAKGRIVGAAVSGGLIAFDYLQPDRLADLLSYDDGEWIAVTPEGTFAGSVGGELGVSVTDGQRAVAIDQLYDAYFRPDMLRRRLAGDRNAIPAPDAIRRGLSVPPPSADAQPGTISTDSATLDITVKDTGGGIGGMRVFHNGKLVRDLGSDEMRRAAERINSSGKVAYRLSLSLPMATGLNDFTVTALNAERSAQSRFSKVSVERPGPSTTPRKAYVLAVGTNEFDHTGFPRLTLAEKSARSVGEKLVATMSALVGAKNVIYLDLVGADSRYESFEAALRYLERVVRPDDLVSIVVTTHGKVLPSGELLAILKDTRSDNAGAMPASRLVSSINRIPALTQILVLDICHAGVVSEQVAEVYQQRFAVFAGSAGIHVLASTSAEEPALAAFNGTTVFSHFLLKALGASRADRAPARSLKRIADAVKRDVASTAARFSFNQVPTTYSFGRDLLLP